MKVKPGIHQMMAEMQRELNTTAYEALSKGTNVVYKIIDYIINTSEVYHKLTRYKHFAPASQAHGPYLDNPNFCGFIGLHRIFMYPNATKAEVAYIISSVPDRMEARYLPDVDALYREFPELLSDTLEP